MKTIIIIFSLITLPINNEHKEVQDKPKTCYCTLDSISWTAYCVQQQWSCEKCCDYTKPKKKDKKDD